MRVLIIGGNRFLGLEQALRLLARGDEVTLLNRGNLGDPCADRVERLIADRGTDSFDHALDGRRFDVALDFALFDGPQAERTVRVLRDKVGQYIMISTGQVYLVREGYRAPAREEDYEGALLPCPTTPVGIESWRYGIEKRSAEDIVAASDLRWTVLRLPMVHGLRDYRHRIAAILGRVLDRGPILVSRGDAPVRHVYGPAVNRMIERLMAKPPSRNAAWNLAQEETLPAREVVRRIAARAGAEARVVDVDPDALDAAGLDPVDACSFSGRWMSCLDSTRAREELGFEHESFEVFLHAVVDALLGTWTEGPHEFMAQRAAELAYARKLGHDVPSTG